MYDTALSSFLFTIQMLLHVSNSRSIYSVYCCQKKKGFINGCDRPCVSGEVSTGTISEETESREGLFFLSDLHIDKQARTREG